MKTKFKKYLSLLLAAVMIFGSVPLAGFVGVDLPNFGKLFETKAKAIEASDLPEDFDLVSYNVYANFDEAEGHYGGLFYMQFRDMIKFGSLSQIVYNSFDNSSEFLLTVEAWEAIRMISDPSSVAEALEFQRQYEEVLFAVLFSALSDKKYTEFSYSDALSKAAGLTDKISSSKTAELLNKTSLDGTEKQELIDTAFAFLTDGKDVESKWSALGEYTDIVNKYISIADDIAGGVVSAINIIDSVSMYVSMLDSGAEVIEYLYDLKGKSPNSVFSAAVQTVINTISNDWVGVVEKTIIDVGFVLGMEATDKLIDYAWTGCCAVFPFLTGLYIGGEIGALACNILFGTEDLIEQYEYLKIMTQIEAVSCALYEDYGESCYASVNSNNASLFTFATRFSYKLYLLGGEAGIEMFNIACNKGIVTKLITGESFDNFEETAIEILDGSRDLYNNVVSCWKKCIEEDYPEFFVTLTEEKIEPKYIESITMDKDEVTFRVGEIMSYSWTIAPLDYEGSLGIKSDNEAVVKSREPMGIQTYALEENIGTANVTIYSIDNPEICDTIKITVIGEDEEGTTEADNKYATGKCGEDLIWVLNKNTGRLTVTGSGDMYNYSLSDTPWYSYKADIKAVTIGNSVTSISNYAFRGCYNLTHALISDSVTKMGISIFYNCSNLTNVTLGKISLLRSSYTEDLYNDESYGFFEGCENLIHINIPDSVTYIGDEAFAGCINLKSITIPDSVTYIGGGVFFGCTSLQNIILPKSIKSLEPSSYRRQSIVKDRGFFEGCTALTSLIIPENVTKIGEYTFKNCSNLLSINIPESVTAVGANAFRDCSNLSSVNIPNSIANIDYGAFYGCKNLKNISMSDGVISIGEYAFYGCENLKIITIPNSVTSIGGSAFYGCKNLNSIIISDSVTEIGPFAFANTGYWLDSNNWENGALYICNHLIVVLDGNIANEVYTIKDGTVTIANQAFDRLDSLKTIIIPDSLKIIGANAFNGCTYLESVVMGNSVTTIGYGAFWDCTALVNIAIPNSVTNIDANAFYNCTSLVNITIPNSVINIGDGAFYNCSKLSEIIIPDNVTTINSGTFNRCTGLKYVLIGKNVTAIGDSAFEYCSELTNVEIPNSVTSIGTNAFYKCTGLTQITIPENVAILGKMAFGACSNITKINYNAVDCDTDWYIYNSDHAFVGCTSLKEINIGNKVKVLPTAIFTYCKGITNISIPDSVTSISGAAFYGCSELKSVTIPKSVKTIGWDAFMLCSNLTDVYFLGTEKDWNTIEIGRNNGCLTSANIHYMEHTHSYTFSITSSATCTKTGVMTYTCDCGDGYTESIPVTSHTASDWQIVIEPTTETTGKKIKKCTVCGVTVAEETIAKLPKEPVKDNSVVKNPSTSSISYGDSIVLHVDASKIPQGGYVEWTSSNGNFDMDVSSDGTTCTITPSSSGDTTFTATIYDANGNAVSKDEQLMTSKAGFFDKIIAFFKNLFGLTKTIPQAFKRIF